MAKKLNCNTCYWNSTCPWKCDRIFIKIIKDDGNPEYIPIHVPACAEYREKEDNNKWQKNTIG